jgi:acylphosphatase
MSEQDQQKAVTARIEGRVQGVWYRAWTTQEATERGLSGWVRNRRDRSVEALFAGPAAAVDDMINACRQGPPSAMVTAVRVQPVAVPTEKGFRQLPTF